MVALSAIMPHGIAIVVTLASRLWTTLGELAAVGVVALILCRSAGFRSLGRGAQNELPPSLPDNRGSQPVTYRKD